MSLRTVHVLVRHPETLGDLPVLVRSYACEYEAHAAKDLAEQYQRAPDAPGQPGIAPAGYAVVVHAPPVGARYMREGVYGLWTREEAQAADPQAWALHEARHAVYRWWTEANPIDRGAPVGTQYLILSVEHVDA
jgi:hypothetical protein